MKIKLSESTKTFLTGFVGLVVMGALVFLAAIISSCTRPTANAQSDTPAQKVVKLKYQNEKQEAIIRAYGDLLHQVWLDKPTYFEECLTESDVFAVLDVLLDSEWGDVFKFRTPEDSISYGLNLDNETTCIHVVKHIVPIPEPTKSRLQSVFGDEIDE